MTTNTTANMTNNVTTNMTSEDIAVVINQSMWEMCNISDSVSPSMLLAAPAPPPTSSGLSALSETERTELMARFRSRLQEEADAINAWEERVGGKYLRLSNLTVEHVNNAFRYRIDGACPLAHRMMAWGDHLLDDARNLTMCAPDIDSPIEMGSGVSR